VRRRRRPPPARARGSDPLEALRALHWSVRPSPTLVEDVLSRLPAHRPRGGARPPRPRSRRRRASAALGAAGFFLLSVVGGYTGLVPVPWASSPSPPAREARGALLPTPVEAPATEVVPAPTPGTKPPAPTKGGSR
jgi:hypothetical protein